MKFSADKLLQQGIEAHKVGHLQEAEQLYRSILQKKPDHPDANHNLGVLILGLDKPDLSLPYFEAALEANPEHEQYWVSMIEALIQVGEFESASERIQQGRDSGLHEDRMNQLARQLESGRNALTKTQVDALIALYDHGEFEELIKQANSLLDQFPKAILLHNNLGVANASLKRFDAAIKNYRRAIEINPDYAEAYYNLGNALKESGNPGAAIESYHRAIEIKPDYAEAHSNLGNVLQENGELTAAIKSCNRATKINPSFAEAHNNLGITLQKKGDLFAAGRSYQRALEIKPDFSMAHNNHATALQERGELTAAILSYNRAIEIDSGYAEAHNHLGGALQESGDLKGAIDSHQRALQIRPDYAEAHNNLGGALQESGDLAAAIASYNRAIKIKPDYAEAHSNLGLALQAKGDMTGAIESYNRALEVKPDFASTHSHQLHQQALICDWGGIEQDRDLISGLGISTDFVTPFTMLSLEDQPAHQLQRSVLYAQNKFKGKALATLDHPSKQSQRLRLGYFSGDFHAHPVMRLIVKMLELHDRTAFEVHGFSFGPDHDDDVRKRLAKSFDTFHDVREMPDQNIAELARNIGIDIAIDLTGYTRNSRSGILACRPAPVQVSYLGYPGSMGTDFIDYLIADRTLIPEQSQKFYSEKIVYMPHCYQVSDNSRLTVEPGVTRAELGLPETGFVFCCFNHNYKITPREFDIWMRLLTKVAGSVLWLRRSNKWSEVNLKKEAETRGIDAGRLVFAQECTYSDYLIRLTRADLFLDTFNYNAGAIANDALWSGLPVLTLQGQSYVARMASSLLTAINLSEMIAGTEDEYEQLALDLAGNPEKLESVRTRLNSRRDDSLLFDTEQFTKDIETAYRQMYDRYFDGEKPAHMFIAEQQPNQLNPVLPGPSDRPAREQIDALVVLYNQDELEKVVSHASTLIEQFPREVLLHNIMGVANKRLRRFDTAIKNYNQALKINSRLPDVHKNLGNALQESGDLNAAVESYKRALNINPEDAKTNFSLGAALQEIGNLTAAIESYNFAIKIKPDYAEAHGNLGLALKQKGDLLDAIESLQRAIEINPGYAEAYNNLANVLVRNGNLTAAIESYTRALKIKPDYASAHSNLGSALRESGNLKSALESCKRAIAIEPNFTKGHSNLGDILLEKGDLTAAIASYNRALQLDPDYAGAHNNLGIALKNKGDLDTAIASYNRAIEIQPDYAEAHNNLAATLQEKGDLANAIASYQNALQLDPDYGEAHNNLGAALQVKGDLPGAIESYQNALQIKPDYAAAYSNLGSALEENGDLAAAIQNFNRALEIKPDFVIALGHKLHQQASICDWSTIEKDCDSIPGLGVAADFVDPFAVLSLEDHPARQLQRSALYAQNKFKSPALAAVARPLKLPEKLRIGYFSADFHAHPVMHLIAKMFELHDRSAFEIHAFSFGPDHDDDMRKRLVKSFDTFHDVREMPDQNIAELARNIGIDIAIDLTGYTRNSRSGILACRPAPLQVSYLGYPGSMGAHFIDYLIADRTLIPEQSQKFYSEKIVYMPHCYQVSDNSRQTLDTRITRAELGLPEAGFVFCCFNNNYKIKPREFDIWMRLLTRVEGSVLWLQRSNKWSEVNLKKEAETRGVDPGRLIFPETCSYPQYLMRLTKADLFLDTFNYNAGAITNDALWCGLPVLTLQGQSYVARMASSLLTTINLPELITASEDEYEEIALDLAGNPEKLESIKARLNTTRGSSLLFDTEQFTKDIETAYRRMYDRYFAGQNPAHLFVDKQVPH